MNAIDASGTNSVSDIPSIAVENLVYLVDANVIAAQEMAAFLCLYEFDVKLGRSCEDLGAMIEERQPDAIILDQMLGKKDSLPQLMRLRAMTLAPVIVLSSHNNQADCVLGLETGADDFLPKTVSGRELVARLRAHLRAHRGGSQVPARPGWRYSKERRTLHDPDGRPVHLTTSEFAILELLIELQGHIVPRDRICITAFGRPWRFGDRSVDNTIVALRRKLHAKRADGCIRAERGVGYMFVGFP